MIGETPTLADVIEFTLEDALVHAHFCIPGKVQSYDPATETVSVIPMTKRVSRDGDDNRIVDVPPVLASVPVAWTRGGGYFLRMPLAAGDSGTILFPDFDLGSWLHSGQVSDPGDERAHGIGGAIFLPGLETAARALAEATGHLVLGKESGPQIHIDASTVQLGAAGGDFLIKASTDFIAWMSAVTAFTGAPAPTLHITTKAKAT